MSMPVPEHEAAAVVETVSEEAADQDATAAGEEHERRQRPFSGRRLFTLLAAASGFVVIGVSAILVITIPSPEERAVDECQQEVLAQLKAPATAEFGDAEAEETEDGYLVTGQVDAQNGFGALIRSDFRCVPIKLTTGETIVWVTFT